MLKFETKCVRPAEAESNCTAKRERRGKEVFSDGWTHADQLSQGTICMEGSQRAPEKMIIWHVNFLRPIHGSEHGAYI